MACECGGVCGNCPMAGDYTKGNYFVHQPSGGGTRLGPVYPSRALSGFTEQKAAGILIGVMAFTLFGGWKLLKRIAR